MALISLEHVTKEYDGKPVVNDLSLKVDQGAVSYTHLTLPTIHVECRSRWSPYH